MKRIITLICLLSSLTSFSQKRNAIWCFGDSAGIDFNNISNPQPISSGIDTRGSCASICDSAGNLLFYSRTRAATAGINTGQIFDRTNNIMQNGNDITGDGWYNEMIPMPFPGSSHLYYLFGTDVTLTGQLTYSIIDMNQNSGLGAVMQKNIQVDTGSYYYDALAAVKHGNGRDWWLIAKKYDFHTNGDNTFEIYLVTPDSISYYPQSIGAICIGNVANMTFSKSGDKFLFTTLRGLIEEFDFDRCSGILNNPKIISLENIGNPPFYWGSAFSPNENIIYVSTSKDTTSALFQFDLTAPNIWSSKITLATFPYPYDDGGALRLAPDDKIYLSNAYNNDVIFNYPYPDSVRNMYNENLSVINDPNNLGTACNFTPYSFYLGGKRTYWGLPNNPDYDLGALVGSACDSLIEGVQSLSVQSSMLSLFPNPFTSKVKLEVGNWKLEKAVLKIYDSLGRLMFSENGIQQGQEFDLSFLSQGVYTFLIQTKEKTFSQKLIKL